MCAKPTCGCWPCLNPALRPPSSQRAQDRTLLVRRAGVGPPLPTALLPAAALGVGAAPARLGVPGGVRGHRGSWLRPLLRDADQREPLLGGAQTCAFVPFPATFKEQQRREEPGAGCVRVKEPCRRGRGLERVFSKPEARGAPWPQGLWGRGDGSPSSRQWPGLQGAGSTGESEPHPPCRPVPDVWTARSPRSPPPMTVRTGVPASVEQPMWAPHGGPPCPSLGTPPPSAPGAAASPPTWGPTSGPAQCPSSRKATQATWQANRPHLPSLTLHSPGPSVPPPRLRRAWSPGRTLGPADGTAGFS